MTPKIDTVNIAYFIPGIVLTVAIALGASEFESPLPGLTGEMSITNGVVFLALSYVVGYAMWALGDWVFRRQSNERIGTCMLHYICIERRIRTHFIEVFNDLELNKLVELLEDPSCKLDELAGEKPTPWTKKNNSEEGEVSDVEPRIQWQDYAGRVRAIAWDLIYSRRNEYHIGRFLSSWNNVKFAKATMCSLLLGGAFYLGCSVRVHGWADLSGGKAVIIDSYLVFGAAYFWIVRWRLRAFARDLVHGLAPNSDVSG